MHIPVIPVQASKLKDKLLRHHGLVGQFLNQRAYRKESKHMHWIGLDAVTRWCAQKPDLDA